MERTEIPEEEEELLILIRLEKVPEPSRKSWTSTIHSQTNWGQMEEFQGHRYPPQEWTTNKDHKTCNNPKGHKGTQENFLVPEGPSG